MSKLHKSVLLFFGFLCLIVRASLGASFPEAKLTITVIDDEGLSLSNMPVHVWLSESAVRDGHTDSSGIFVAQGECTIKDIPISIVKQGYYDSRLTYSYPNYMSVEDHKWQPWNPTVTVVVRRILNPTAMYAKRVEAVVPSANKACGYDLVVGDWVVPFGRGNRGDLIFTIVERRVTSWTDCEGTLSVTFSNQGDGLCVREGILVGGSSFPWPYSAPNDGYSGAIEMSMGYAPEKGLSSTNPTAACYLRVRTVTNDCGEVVSANYGKIPGPIAFDVREGNSGWVGFTYYLNPTPNDRNLEFDPGRNLFTNLPVAEQVREP